MRSGKVRCVTEKCFAESAGDRQSLSEEHISALKHYDMVVMKCYDMIDASKK